MDWIFLAILFDEKSQIFNLQTKTSSYIFKILCDKVLIICITENPSEAQAVTVTVCFFALSESGADEFCGNVYGFSLVYSGNFVCGVECDSTNVTRAYMDINPFNFNWLLNSGDEFSSPEAIMVYSDKGFSKMSHIFHRLYRNRLCRGAFRDKVRSVLANNWEGTRFDFNEEKILAIAENAKKIEVDLFVLDDGCFGKRDDSTCSPGDWVTNTKTLPGGMSGLADKINKLGMEFGLWFKPEMVSPDSNLYIFETQQYMYLNT